MEGVGPKEPGVKGRPYSPRGANKRPKPSRIEVERVLTP
jgi:hypothetical protein